LNFDGDFSPCLVGQQHADQTSLANRPNLPPGKPDQLIALLCKGGCVSCRGIRVAKN
jgi:hypothetical protein